MTLRHFARRLLVFETPRDPRSALDLLEQRTFRWRDGLSSKCERDDLLLVNGRHHLTHQTIVRLAPLLTGNAPHRAQPHVATAILCLGVRAEIAT